MSPEPEPIELAKEQADLILREARIQATRLTEAAEALEKDGSSTADDVEALRRKIAQTITGLQRILDELGGD